MKIRFFISGVLLVLMVNFLFVLNVGAISDYRLHLGRHDFLTGGDNCADLDGQGEGTNMVLQFVLDRGVLDGEAGEIEIFLSADGEFDGINGLSNINNNGYGVFLYNLNDGSPVWHDLSSAGHFLNVDNVNSKVTISWLAGYGNDLTEGDEIRIYFGFSDTDALADPDDCIDGVTGIYSESGLPFNPPSDNYLRVFTYSNTLFVDLKITYDGKYVEQKSANVPASYKTGVLRSTFLSASNIPFMKITITGYPLHLTNMDYNTYKATDSLEIEVETNSSDGYSLRYKSTDFQDDYGNKIDPAPGGASLAGITEGTGLWGVNFVENSFFGVDPVDHLGTSNLASNYNQINKFTVNVGSAYEEIAYTDTASKTIYTMTWVVAPAKLSSAGDYSAKMYFYLYSSF